MQLLFISIFGLGVVVFTVGLVAGVTSKRAAKVEYQSLVEARAKGFAEANALVKEKLKAPLEDETETPRSTATRF